jgi:hypothetical protein
MRLAVEPYLTQKDRLPKSRRYIVAQYDDESIVVYQADRQAIGHFAVEHDRFGEVGKIYWFPASLSIPL